MTTKKIRCCGAVASLNSWWSNPCKYTGKLEHDGKRYCAVHYPPNVELRRSERSAKFEADFAAKQKGWDKLSLDATRAEAFPRVRDALKEASLVLTGSYLNKRDHERVLRLVLDALRETQSL